MVTRLYATLFHMPGSEKIGNTVEKKEALDTFSERELLALDDPKIFTRGEETTSFPAIVHWIVNPRRTPEELKLYLSKLGASANDILAPYYAKPLEKSRLEDGATAIRYSKSEIPLLRALTLHMADVRQAHDMTTLGVKTILSAPNKTHVDKELLVQNAQRIDGMRDQFYIRHRAGFKELDKLFEKIRELSGGALTPENIFRPGHVPPYREQIKIKQGRVFSIEQVLTILLVIIKPPNPSTFAAIQARLNQTSQTRGCQVREFLLSRPPFSRDVIQLLNDKYITGSDWLSIREKRLGENW